MLNEHCIKHNATRMQHNTVHYIRYSFTNCLNNRKHWTLYTTVSSILNICLTLPLSVQLVTMMMACDLFSQTILQKSLTVDGSGPWAAMYCLLALSYPWYAHKHQSTRGILQLMSTRIYCTTYRHVVGIDIIRIVLIIYCELHSRGVI